MGLIAQITATGYRCDKSGCTAEISGEPMKVYLAEEHYRTLAIEAGWTFTKHRRLWVHCPDHARKDHQ